jgi:hypothetical protein
VSETKKFGLLKMKLTIFHDEGTFKPDVSAKSYPLEQAVGD